MTWEIHVPTWFADKIREKYGSLENYVREDWNNSIKVIDDYWHGLAQESMERLNNRG